MYVLKPITVTPSNMTNDIAEPSAGETVWAAGTYNTGDDRISTTTHKVYRSIVDGNTLNPELDVYDENGAGAKWFIVGATNKWRMFDEIVGSQSAKASSMTVELTTGRVIGGVAVFNLTASAANVTVTDPVDGVVYDKDIEMIDNSAVVDMWTYLTEPIVQRKEFALWDLPGYLNADVTFTFTGGSDLAVGEIVLGQVANIGIALHGSGYQLLNFNVTERDEFGNIKPTRGRRTAKLAKFNVKVPTSKTSYTFKQLDDLRQIPAVYSGSVTDDKTLIYGYHSDVIINFSSPSVDDLSLEVEGLT